MIASRYLLREVLLATAAIAAVLLLVTVGARASGYLADAAAGRLSGGAVLAVLGLRLPEFLALLAPLAFLLGVLVAVGRLQAGSELTVLRAAGLGDDWLRRRLLVAAAVVAVVVAALTLWLAPAAGARIETVLGDEAGLAALASLPPGRFRRLGDDGRVARAGGVDVATGELRDVLLIEASETGGRRVLRAARGALRIEPGTGRRLLELVDGDRWELPGDGPVRRAHFARLAQPLDSGAVTAPPADVEVLPSAALLLRTDAASRAELHWRLVLPALVLVVAVLAVRLVGAGAGPGGGGRPGGHGSGSGARLGLGLGVFLAVFAALVVGRDAAGDGAVSPWLGLWTPLVLAALAAGVRFPARGDRPRGVG